MEAARLLGRLRLPRAGTRLQLLLLAPGVTRRSRRRGAALHECNARVSLDGYFNSNTGSPEPRNLRQRAGGYGGSRADDDQEVRVGKELVV